MKGCYKISVIPEGAPLMDEPSAPKTFLSQLLDQVGGAEALLNAPDEELVALCEYARREMCRVAEIDAYDPDVVVKEHPSLSVQDRMPLGAGLSDEAQPAPSIWDRPLR